MKKLVVLTGAGISAESGIKTFRDDNGLWKNHRFEELASPNAWRKNPKLVLEFYNVRRKNVVNAQANDAHFILTDLEEHFSVQIITQNVDDLHERAGSKNILHLHGEIRKARSTMNENLICEIAGSELNLGDLCEKKLQLRPHIVWFGESVPNFQIATEIASEADIFLIIGTSLVVYPAASLLEYVPNNTSVFIIDKNANYPNSILNHPRISVHKGLASEMMRNLQKKLIDLAD